MLATPLVKILTTRSSLCPYLFNVSELIGNKSASSTSFQLSISLAVSDTVFFSLLNQSYEHSWEIELAHLKSNCPKSFVQYARYELGDCRRFDLREREKKTSQIRPSLSWESVIGVTSLRFFICVSLERMSPREWFLHQDLHFSFVLDLCLYVNLQRKKERQ